MSDSALTRVLGGSPLTVLMRLIFASLLAGALMSWLDIDPLALLTWLQAAARHVWATGFEGLHQVGRYIVAGAAVVLPVWIALRLLSAGSVTRSRRLPDGSWRRPADVPFDAARPGRD